MPAVEIVPRCDVRERFTAKPATVRTAYSLYLFENQVSLRCSAYKLIQLDTYDDHELLLTEQTIYSTNIQNQLS